MTTYNLNPPRLTPLRRERRIVILLGVLTAIIIVSIWLDGEQAETAFERKVAQGQIENAERIIVSVWESTDWANAR